jgi:hypothetical protein
MGHRIHLLTNVMPHCVVDPQLFTCSTSYVRPSKALIMESNLYPQTSTLGYQENK